MSVANPFDLEANPPVPVHGDDVGASLDPGPVANNDMNEQNKLEAKKKKKDKISSAIIIIGLTSMVLQFLAMAWAQSTVMFVAGIIGVSIAPLVVIRQFVLMRMDTLRCVHNKLRMEINKLTLENNALQRNVDDLQVEVGKVSEVEGELAQIAESQGSNVGELIDLVKDNGIVLKAQEKCARAAFQESLLTTILRTDRDQSMTISEREANILIMRMRNQDGIHLDEDRFRQALAESHTSISSVLKIVREIDQEHDDFTREDSMIKVDSKVLVQSQGNKS